MHSVKAVVSGLCNRHTRAIDGPQSGRYRDLGAINYLWRPTTTCIVAAIIPVIDLCRHAATLILASGNGDLDDVLVPARPNVKRSTQAYLLGGCADSCCLSARCSNCSLGRCNRQSNDHNSVWLQAVPPRSSYTSYVRSDRKEVTHNSEFSGLPRT